VGDHGLVHEVLGVRVLRHRVEEGAAAKTGEPDALGDGPADGSQGVGRGEPAGDGVVGHLSDGSAAFAEARTSSSLPGKCR
jgi:hypothetical protein